MGIKTFTHTVIERSIGRFGHELKLVGSPANSTAKCATVEGCIEDLLWCAKA